LVTPESETSSPPALLYHKVGYRWEVGITRTTPEGFSRQIAYLVKIGYQPTSLHDLHEEKPAIAYHQSSPAGGQKILRCRSSSAEVQKAVGLAFDDAYLSVYEHAFPVLRQHRINATLFIPVNFIGKYNTWEARLLWRKFRHMDIQQIREWVNVGMELGCHTASHVELSLLSPKQWRVEIVDCKHWLEDTFSTSIEWFAPPFGWYNTRLLMLLQETGYHGMAVIQPLRKVKAPEGFLIQSCTGVYYGDPLFLIRAKIDPAHPLHKLEQKRLAFIHGGSKGTVLVQAFRKWKSV